MLFTIDKPFANERTAEEQFRDDAPARFLDIADDIQVFGREPHIAVVVEETTSLFHGACSELLERGWYVTGHGRRGGRNKYFFGRTSEVNDG